MNGGRYMNNNENDSTKQLMLEEIITHAGTNTRCESK